MASCFTPPFAPSPLRGYKIHTHTHPSMKLIAPNGKEIIGTEERIPGTAHIINSKIEKQDDGTFEFDYEGETKVFWDGQETRYACGQRIFTDEDGGLWLERELRLVPEDGETQTASDLTQIP